MYDARDPSSIAGRGDIIFSIVVLVVVGGAFFLGWKGPELLGLDSEAGGGGGAALVEAGDDSLTSTFADRESKRYLSALKTLDADAYADLQVEVARAGSNRRDQRIAVSEHMEVVVARHAGSLAKANVRHFDGMMSEIQTGLQRASSSKSRYCQGSFYANADKMSEREMRRLAESFVESDEFFEFSMGFSAVVLEAAIDAKKNPANYGSLTSADEQAIQNTFMSLMGDPQIMSLIMQAQNGGGASSLDGVDFCRIGNTFVSAVRRLPAQTKGRLWAEAFRNGADGFNSFSGGFGGLGGF